MQTSTVDQTPRNAIAGDHWIETLRDGSHVQVRPLRADDRARETEFIRRLSPQAQRFRFLGEFRDPPERLVDQLMAVDGAKDVALVALAHDDGELREVGIARYSASDHHRTCECAVTVADDWHDRGLGYMLMRHLIDVARRNGFHRMFSLDSSANGPMRELASSLGFRREEDPGDATLVTHTLDF
ncbi:MAG TPA: GNAT family N-acetyltransferase [Pinirhizobacter sp.]|uniref:GNAT family N-acetyltransferase n=1 Tax=Pinirhizobacter sp. TaxID=2950432 RepID=UPI002C101C84|nr:GNAT family N-acetyltransferase [Pinirhizobacter sp.]HMH67559.1 GNAT family N-acetyltransferase [Pinirhizobacter sp.]